MLIDELSHKVTYSIVAVVAWRSPSEMGAGMSKNILFAPEFGNTLLYVTFCISNSKDALCGHFCLFFISERGELSWE